MTKLLFLSYFVIFAVLGFFAIGWVKNIIAIFDPTNDSFELVLRCIGVLLAPLGGLFGWFL